MGLLWVELHPPQRYAEALTPETYEMWLTWQEGLCRCDQVKMRSYSIRMGPNPTWMCFYNKRRKHRHRHRHRHMREESHVRMEAQIAPLQLQAQEGQGFLAFQYEWKALHCHSNFQKWGRGKKVFSPKGFRRSMVLLTHWFWTFSFQNCETIHFCCLKPSSVWCFLQKP